MALTHVPYDAGGWGTGELWLDGTRLVWHELPRPQGPPRASSRFERTEPRVTKVTLARAESVPCKDGDRPADPLAARLRAYFDGARDVFADVELDLTWTTPFQLAVARALRGVAYGELVTYGELAALAGYPNAHRAAATFCARNRFPVVLPCHRVVAADGLGGYGSLGLGYKRALLELERAV